MGTKISALTATTTPASADLAVLVQGGTTKQVTYGNWMKNAPAGTAAAPSVAFTGDTTGLYSPGTGILGFSAAGVEPMRVNAARFLKVSPTGAYASSTAAYHELRSNQNASITLNMAHIGTDPYGFQVNFTAATPDNNTNYFGFFADATATRAVLYSDGDWQNHDNSYGAISDERLKQDIQDASLVSQYNDIKAIRLRKYRFKSDVEADPEAGQHIGVVAQELMTVSPGLVKVGADGFYGVEYSVLNLKMLGALQHLITRVEALEAA